MEHGRATRLTALCKKDSRSADQRGTEDLPVFWQGDRGHEFREPPRCYARPYRAIHAE